jgi:glycosyltransferase involved in cell wall biosynthesis
LNVVVIAGYAPSLLNFRRELLHKINASGHRAIAIAPDIGIAIKESLVKMGIHVHSVPLKRTGFNPIQDLALLHSLVRLFRGESPNAVLSYTIKPVIFGSIAAAKAGVPGIFSIITGLGYAFLGQNLKQRVTGVLAKVLYRRALGHNRRVFFQNPDDYADFLRMRLIRNENQAICINGSGVNLEHFYAAQQVVNPVRFVMAGRFYQEKGIHEFVTAARSVKLRYPKVCYELVGGIDSNPSAIKKEELARWQREGVITHTGWVEDVRPLIRQASVYVLPSYREGTPRSVLEAMAMGRPVITTDAPGCRETVLLTANGRNQRKNDDNVMEGENGFLVPIKNVDALVEAMERFIKNPKLIVSMGKRSREIAEQKYDVHRVNEVILKNMGLL